jgi:hypothetical protein
MCDKKKRVYSWYYIRFDENVIILIHTIIAGLLIQKPKKLDAALRMPNWLRV